MKLNHKRVALLLALVAVVGMATPAMGAPGYDSSGTDATSTVSAVQPGDTIENFSANGSDKLRFQFVGQNGTSPHLELSRNGSDVVTASNTSMENVSVGSEGTHWNATISEGSLADVEMSINENVTMDVTAINGSNTSDTTTDQIYLENTNERSVETVTSEDIGEDLIGTLTDEDGYFSLGGDDKTELNAEDREVNGSNTDVVISLENASVAEDFSAATEDTHPFLFMGSAAESGDQIYTAPAFVSDSVVPTYYEQAPEDVDETSTYAVYKEDVGGTPALVYNLGEEYDDRSSVDVSATGNQHGMWSGFQTFGINIAW